MRSFYSKLVLTLADMPADQDVLIESLRQLSAVFIDKPETTVFDDIHLTAAELLRLQSYIRGDILVSNENGSSYVLLHRVRKKLKEARDIEIPCGNSSKKAVDLLNPEDRKILSGLFVEGQGPHDDIMRLEKILGFHPAHFDERRLPKTIPELRQLTLDILNLLRGDPTAIHIPNMSSPSERIFLSTLIAKTHGCVTRERLFVSLYPPFVEDPSAYSLTAFAKNVRKILLEHGIEFKTHRNMGYSMDVENRAKLYALMEQPFIPVTPRRLPSAPAHSAN